MPRPAQLPVSLWSAMRDVHEVLRETWGYSAFRPLQEQVVRHVCEGRDTLALLPTGGGKSLCFQVPALATGRLCLVVSPLIALINDQVARLKARGVRAVAITSGMDHSEIDNALETAAVGRASFLYVSPERLASELFKARLHRLPLGSIAVDEAHCISQWGYDFRPAYMRVAELRDAHPDVPVIALTASATPEVARDIMERLRFRAPNLVKGEFRRPELTLWVSHGQDKMGRLLRIAQHVAGTGIVYLRDRKGTVRVAELLRRHGIDAAAYHAGLPFEERQRIQQAWTDNEVRIVAATNAFGMGIDKADVRFVVHLAPPPDVESYYQEAGRAGRDGSPSQAFLLVSEGDEAVMRERMAAGFPTLPEVRRVFQAFADQHRIAHGAGAFETYPLDVDVLGQRTGLHAQRIIGALKVLEIDGTIALSDGARTPSRVLMRAAPEAVYHMRVQDPRLGPLLEALLRLYGGLYEEYAIVEEDRMARLLGWTTARVRATLHELERLHVIFFRPRSDRPTVTLLVPRPDAARLSPAPAALRDREQRARARMEAMADITFRPSGCRERAVLAYFGASSDADCGRCDVCMGKRSAPHRYQEPGLKGDMVSEVEQLRWDVDTASSPET